MEDADVIILILFIFLVYKAQEWFNGSSPKDTVKRPTETTDMGELPTEMKYTKYKVVIAIDFGTTYSGCTLGFPGNGTIKYIEKWPNQIGTYSKIPTAILYDAEGNVKQWGQTAETTKSKGFMPRGWHYCARFKLLLDENFKSSGSLPRLPSGKEFVDVIADYLHEMHEYVLTKVDKKYTREEMRYTLTIPASWSPDAKRYMRSAAIRAGLVKKGDSSERLNLVSEPEAALINCMKTHPNIESSNTVMICDAGGGTVDMCTFKINKKANGELDFHEISLGKGKSIGSVMLDMNFDNFLRNIKLGPDVCSKLDIRDVPNMVEEFITSVKPIFKPGIWEYRIESPLHRDPMFLDLLPSDTVVDGTQLVFTFEELRDRVFDPIIHEITALVDDQVRYLQKKKLLNPVCDKLLLVGGFGENEYLYQRLRGSFQTTGAIRSVDKVANPSMAVVRGAAYLGIYPKSVSFRISRYSYGICTMPLFVHGFHPDSKKVIGGNGVERCESVYKELVKQGEEVDLSKFRDYSFKSYYKDRSPEVKIYAYDGMTSPRYVDDPGVFYVGDVKITKMPPIARIVNAKNPLEVKLFMYFGHTEVKTTIEIEKITYTAHIENMHS